MKKLLLLVCAAVFLSYFQVSADVISGTVTDSATGAHLSSVRISTDPSHVTYSATDGSFSLNTASGVLSRPRLTQKNLNISYKVANLHGEVVRQSSFDKPDFSRLPSGIYIVTEKANGFSPVSYKVSNVLNFRLTPQLIANSRNITAGTQAAAATMDTLTFSVAGYLTTQRIVTGSQSGLAVKMAKAPSNMAFILGGTSQMGDSSQWSPKHTVTVSSFYMDSTDVTQASYLQLMGYNPSYFRISSSLPVESVTWFDAVLYCNARSKRDGYDTVYAYASKIKDTASPNSYVNLSSLVISFGKNGYRLPTEAEWEYACRGGTTSKFFWGNDTALATVGQYAWYYQNSSSSTHPVALKQPNEYGLYDICGNVQQWCFDWYGDYSSQIQTDPTGPSLGTSITVRSGSWDSYNAVYFLSAYRINYRPGERWNTLGFRCVRRDGNQALIPIIRGAPAAPAIVYPTNGAVGITFRPILSWSTVSRALSYQVQVSTISTFSTSVTSQIGLTVASTGISDLAAGKTYYWRVNAANSEGTSAWAGTWSFTTFMCVPGMVHLPGGTFQMGSTNTLLDGSPVHNVTIPSFYMDSTDVTQADYTALMGMNPSYFDTGVSAPRRPVENVTFYNAIVYCNARSKRDGYDTMYSYSGRSYCAAYGSDTLAGLLIDYTKHGYRLPTEAEWEYACRAGSTTDFYWGQSYPPTTSADTAEISLHAWWYKNSGSCTHAVATKPANAFGLYDMSGNVFQWCNDWLGSYSQSTQTDPKGASSGFGRVLRGGSWANRNSSVINGIACGGILCATYRFDFFSWSVSNDFGFRCVWR